MRTVPVAVLALAVLAAACSDDDGETASTPTSPAAATSVPSVSRSDASNLSPATSPASTPAPVIEDTQAVGGTSLYTVDLKTGAAEAVGQVGTEIGVLGLTVDGDGSLIGLTDVPELISFTSDDPATITARVPVGGIEGSTLLTLDLRTDDSSLLALGDAGSLVNVDLTTGAATPVGVDGIPFADPGIGFDVDLVAGTLVVVDASGAHLEIDVVSGAVTDAPPFAFADDDANTGAAPRLVAVAVADDGTRYAIDAGTASLVALGADGVLTTIGPLGAGVTDGASFDIGPDGRALLTSPG